jgi:formate/nitrite transporter FocA (FNT family)
VGQFSPGTIGNIIGGAVMVAALYWFVYSSKQGSFLGKM